MNKFVYYNGFKFGLNVVKKSDDVFEFRLSPSSRYSISFPVEYDDFISFLSDLNDLLRNHFGYLNIFLEDNNNESN